MCVPNRARVLLSISLDLIVFCASTLVLLSTSSTPNGVLDLKSILLSICVPCVLNRVRVLWSISLDMCVYRECRIECKT